ncbi:hypothetical protein KUCAC02_000688 [Chaenocephalus aceratus]|uniref:Uncharacterized protein n=1 Tax=Chaenocephalus aceratus TaxID=36190 RepID=A0ACB9W785_CHAAC|nr:hypothetical protein KUCAC02_000688 [Chaenocephalus aceratus]
MRTSHILLLCILGHALFASVFCNNVSGPDDCCFDYHPRSLNKKFVRSYYMDRRQMLNDCKPYEERFDINLHHHIQKHPPEATMRTSHILLLCILGHALFASVFCNNVSGPDDCCFDYHPRSLNKK